jgi:lysophospholipase L1-like esterase
VAGPLRIESPGDPDNTKPALEIVNSDSTPAIKVTHMGAGSANAIEIVRPDGTPLWTVGPNGENSGSVSRGNTVMALGDSITAHGYTALNGVPYADLDPQAYLLWASMLSQGQIVFSGVAATSSFKLADIIATHLPTVLAAKPAACLLLGGTNDIGLTSLATMYTQAAFIFTSLASAGTLPVVCTIPPRAGDSATLMKQLAQYNAWLTRYAQSHGLPLVDFYNHLVDPATGGWLSGLNLDSVHPNGAGAKVMGQLISDVLCGTNWVTLKPTSGVLPAVFPYLAANNTDTATLLTNPLMLTDSGAPVGRPSGWSLLTGAPTAESAATDATTLGKYYSLTGIASLANNAAGSTAVAGDLIYVACRIGATLEASGGRTSAGFGDTGGSQDYFRMAGWDKDIPLGSVLAFTFTMPLRSASSRT